MAESAVLAEVLAVLRDQRPRARAMGVELVGVVGSVARGSAGPQSDIDVVYDVKQPGYLWDLVGLAADLEDILGRRIDLVDREMMQPDRWAWMSRDLVIL